MTKTESDVFKVKESVRLLRNLADDLNMLGETCNEAADEVHVWLADPDAHAATAVGLWAGPTDEMEAGVKLDSAKRLVGEIRYLVGRAHRAAKVAR
jgi:hypothetical protein